jgi:hypothetical protein
MKELLYVQTGDGKPKCRKSFGPSQGLNRARAHAYVSNVSDRWWLVECENAEHGREVIAHSITPCRLHPSECYWCSGNGCILASRGAR